MILSALLLAACSGRSGADHSGPPVPTDLRATLFFGGSGQESLSWLNRPFVGDTGDLLIAGETLSDDLPVTPDALDPTYGGGNTTGREDSFLAILDYDLQNVTYASYLGGNEGPEFISDLYWTKDGTLYIAGNGGSADYPVTPDAWIAEQPGPYFGHADGIFTRLGDDGRTLEYSTYVGGRGIDWVTHEFVDEVTGVVTLFGITDSNGFPPGDPITEPNLEAAPTLFALQLSPTGDLLDSHLLANSWTSDVRRLADGDFVIAGNTTNPEFEGSQGAYDRDFNGGTDQAGGDVFVMRLSSDITTVEYLTLIGGSGEDSWPRLTPIDGDDVVVVGRTTSTDLPVTRNARVKRMSDDGALFLARISADGSTLVYCSYWGSGEPWDAVTSIVYGPDGRIYLAGTTASQEFPVTDDAFDSELGGPADAFLVVMDTDRFRTVYATYLGGSEQERQVSIVLDDSDRLVVYGSTNSTDFPTPAAGAAPGGKAAPNGWDLFVMLFD